jgi:hypothetical protein
MRIKTAVHRRMMLHALLARGDDLINAGTLSGQVGHQQPEGGIQHPKTRPIE